MKIDITEKEYLDAVSEVCELVKDMHTRPHETLNSQDASLKRFIAAIYDPIIPCNVLETLMMSNQPRSNLLLALLIGRCKYGRPHNERTDEMLLWGQECLKDTWPNK
jgi:hypothetical protein